MPSIRGFALVLLVTPLLGCTAIVRTDFAVIDAGADAGLDGGAVDAGRPDAGLDAGCQPVGPTCDPDGCGCDDRHCYPAAGDARICTSSPGGLGEGAACTRSLECLPGLACARGGCRVWCLDSSECAARVGEGSSCAVPVADSDSLACSDACVPSEPCGPSEVCTLVMGGAMSYPSCVTDDMGPGPAFGCPPAECGVAYTCAFGRCLRWCRLSPAPAESDCSTGFECVAPGSGSPRIDAQEYGVCRRV